MKKPVKKVTEARIHDFGNVKIKSSQQDGEGSYIEVFVDRKLVATGDFDLNADIFFVGDPAVGYDTLDDISAAYGGGIREEQLDELSPKTLGSYAKKASDDKEVHDKTIGKYRAVPSFSMRGGAKRDNDSALKKSGKRKHGINRAIDKMTEATDVPNGYKRVKKSDFDVVYNQHRSPERRGGAVVRTKKGTMGYLGATHLDYDDENEDEKVLH